MPAVSFFKVVGNLNDVTDFTDSLTFIVNLVYLTLNVFENTLWYIVELLTLLLFAPLSIVMIVGDFVAWLNEILFGKKLQGSKCSAVNSTAPNMLRKYKPDFNKLSSTLEKSTANIPTMNAVSVGDMDTAQFFLMLSAVVYEENGPHQTILNAWGFTRITRLIYSHGCSCTIVSHKFPNGKLFVGVCFKGTSPFDLNGWLTDANMQRNYDQSALYQQFGYNVGYGVSDGFYKALLTIPIPSSKASGGVGSALQEILDAFQKEVNHAVDADPNFDPKIDVNVWVTGHSLGAALASTFVTILMCKRASKSPNKTLQHMRSSLAGVYTFGTPKMCSENCAKEVNRELIKKRIPFRRIRNGNDIVGAVPFGHGMFENILIDLSTIFFGKFGREISDPITVSSISDFGVLGKELRFGYFGNLYNPLPQPDFSPALDREKALVNIAHQLKYSVKKNSYDLSVTFKNTLGAWAGYWPVSFAQFFNRKTFDNGIDEATYSTTAASLAAQTFGPGIIFDHIPANYARNMNLYAKRIATRNEYSKRK